MTYESILEFWKNQNIKNANELESMLSSYSINFAYNSGKIENDEITYHDTREVFDKDGVTSYTGSTKTLFEIQNSKAAYERMLSAFDDKQIVDEEFLKEIQMILTNGTYDERRYQIGERPGEYKHHDYVTGKNEVGAPVDDVQEEICELLDELTDIDDKNALVAAAYFHAKFENIHPFSDGNGRVGRLLMNYILLIHNHPPITIYEEDRKDYYNALEQFDEKLELNSLINFLKSQLFKTWEKQLNKSKQKSSLTDFVN
ncbi:MAG: Fic family protein [Acetobacter sp.]|nr:Fic family protein [Bacteroides sp.]MCM1340148.1 Fic family protein [Acetobacter sp.]MCM1432729.1 Fic family protein [Clostridiales bacterium]